MTLQLQSLNRAVLPEPPSQGIQDFQLIVMNNSGTELITQFSAYKYSGLDREVACAVAPGGAVKTLTFTGFPHMVGCAGGEVVVFRLNDGDGWQDVFYGAVTQGWAAKKLPGGVRDYLADADYLLNGTVVDATAYPAQDPALIAHDLVRRLRHPALNFTELDFPPTGTTLEGGFEQPGVPLGEALKVLAQSVTDSGRTITYGVDGRGYVFFKQLTGTLEVPYYPEDYTDLPIQADNTVTAVLWVIGNEPNRTYQGEYKPKTLTYLSVPDEAEHQKYGRTLGLAYSGSPFVPKPRVSYSSLGFAYPENGSNSGPDGNPIPIESVAVREGTTDSVYTINGLYPNVFEPYLTGGLPIYGARLRYQRGYDATGRALLQLFFFAGLAAKEKPSSFGLAVPFDLPYTGTEFANFDVILPPAGTFRHNEGAQLADYKSLSNFYAAQVAVSPPGTFLISDFRFLCLDTTLLDNAARAELRTPAQEPARLILRRGDERNRAGYYAPPLAAVKLSNGQSSDAAEYRYAFDRTNGVSTVVDLGSPSREGDAALAERIRLAIDVTAERTKLQLGAGRL